MSLSYQQKFDQAKPSYVKVNERRFADLPGGTTVLVPSPQDIETEIWLIPAGGQLSFGELRNRLAFCHAADGTCPVMTGMNLRVVAEIAFEALRRGEPKNEVAPVWRVIDPASALAAKLADGPERLRRLRAEETIKAVPPDIVRSAVP